MIRMSLSRMWPILFLLCGISCADPTFDVQISIGKVNATIRGIEHSYGRSFRGIRYAQPPVQNLRFMPAQQLDPSGLVDATGYKSSCQQHNGNSHEDCLFINVFTPKGLDLNAKLPVFFWIHGGGFTGGSGDLGAGMYENMINRGPIILVSINYRLGPFGFLTSRTSDAPGNAGISDCIEALQWVRRYIRFFGGDPNKVTVGGQSSGAEAVSFVSLTTKSVGLYRSLILESGSAFGAAVMSYSEKTRNTSADLAIRMGCATEEQWTSGKDFHDVIACLKTKTPAAILSVDNSLPGHRMKWAPVKDTTLFPDRLENLALSRKAVPVLAGDVHDEWIGWDWGQISKHLNGSLFTRDGVAESLQKSNEITYWDKQNDVFKAAANHYVYSNNIRADDHVNWARDHYMMFGELVFIGPVLRDAKYFAHVGSNVYLYSFDYLAPKGMPDHKDPELRGVPHAWELQYLFNEHLSWGATDDDKKLIDLMGRWWTNFVIYGNPTPPNGFSTPITWPTLTAKGNQNEFVSIGPKPLVANGYHPMSMFWVCDAPGIDGYRPPYCN